MLLLHLIPASQVRPGLVIDPAFFSCRYIKKNFPGHVQVFKYIALAELIAKKAFVSNQFVCLLKAIKSLVCTLCCPGARFELGAHSKLLIWVDEEDI